VQHRLLYSFRALGTQDTAAPETGRDSGAPIPADSLTVASIAIIAYMLATMLHEGVGMAALVSWWEASR
jgi:hypothetical protein